MSSSFIVTGQYVRINLTPANVGERLIATLIDYLLIIIYSVSMYYLLSQLEWYRTMGGLLFWVSFVYLPVLFYSFLCETFNRGQSLGKKLLNLRVVKADGSSPSVGDYFLRWLLLLFEGPLTAFSGVLFMLLTKNRQRLGDLAAGTIVTKEKNYKKIHVSLDEFEFLSQNYRPVYPQASELSLEQVNVITRALESREKDRMRRILLLAPKVQELLGVKPRGNSREEFLKTVLRDYQYYALEEE